MKAFLNDKFRTEYPNYQTITNLRRTIYTSDILSAISMSYRDEQGVHAHCITSVMPENAPCELSSNRPSFRQGSKTAARPTVIEPLIAKVA